MEKYRIRFRKEGRAKYISHLDLLRIFTRCARRTGIDLEYSQGFNPHAEIVFSAPLPLGMTSEAEYADLQLAGPADEEKLLKTLVTSLPEGISPVKITRLEPGAANVMKNVSYCRYELFVSFGDPAEREIFPGLVRSCLDGEKPVMTAKKSKSGTKVVDIRPMILSFCDGFSAVGDNACTFGAVLAAGNEQNLRPEVALRGICDAIGGKTAVNGASDRADDDPDVSVGCKLTAVRKLEYLDSDKRPLW